MQLIPAGAPVPFEVTFDAPGLFVGLTVLDVSTGTPVMVGSVIPMVNLAGSNSYFARFTPVNNKQYVFLKQVYIDGSYTALDPDYATGSESSVSSNFTSEISLILQSLPSFSVDGGLVGFAYCNEISYGPLGNVEPVEIVRGSKAVIKVKILRKNTLDPLDLTGLTNVLGCFLNDDGSEFMMSLLGGQISIVGDRLLGNLAITLTTAQTALFAVDYQATLQLGMVFASGDPLIFKIPQAYSILPSDC